MVVFLIIISVVSCVIFHCNAKIKIKGIRKNLKLRNPSLQSARFIASSFEGGLRRVTVLNV
jgi:hypothetical protein